MAGVMTRDELIKYAQLRKAEETREKEWQKLLKAVGQGYDEFLLNRNRYRILKGGRGSKKSTTAFTELPWRIMNYPKSNAVVVRNVYNTHKDSTYAEIQKGAERLGALGKFKFTVNPFEITYKPTGQKILFRGFDDVLKLTSINVAKGHLCWVYVEEAFEIVDPADFDTMDESIRGILPPWLWHQITLTYNPWVQSHWTKTRYWDNDHPDTYRLTTTHHINEFLTEKDHQKIENLQITDPDRYQVVGLGEYGIPGGAYFDEFRRTIHVVKPFIIPSSWNKYRAIDYGLDMLACYWIAVDPNNNAFIYKELHEPNHIISSAANRIKEMSLGEEIVMTYAPPDLWNRRQETGKSAADLFAENGVYLSSVSNNRVQGWYNMKEWLRPHEIMSEQTGDVLKLSRMRIFDSCFNLINYLPQAQKDEKNPNDVSTDPHHITHCLDAIRSFVSGRPTPEGQILDSLHSDDEDEDEEDIESWHNLFYG